MSDVKQFFPANRLASALSTATPKTVEQCLRQADENLRHISIACRDHIDGSLGLVEATLPAWPAAYDRDYLCALQEMIVRIIGVATTAGLPILDQAAASLTDVIDAMILNERWERPPVVVHVNAMRLLRNPALDRASASHLLTELAKVRDLFLRPV